MAGFVACDICAAPFLSKTYNHCYCEKCRADAGLLARHRRGRESEPCKEPGCRRRRRPGRSGLCDAHHQIAWRQGVGTCGIDGCALPVVIESLCSIHFVRLRNAGELGAPRLRKGRGSRMRNGYVKIGLGLEHRMVMEAELGRPLRPFENVHHKNGIRHDNRPENLEIWVTPQRSGQRPDDLVAFVVENYPEAVEAALAQSSQLKLMVGGS